MGTSSRPCETHDRTAYHRRRTGETENRGGVGWQIKKRYCTCTNRDTAYIYIYIFPVNQLLSGGDLKKMNFILYQQVDNGAFNSNVDGRETGNIEDNMHTSFQRVGKI